MKLMKEIKAILISHSDIIIKSLCQIILGMIGALLVIIFIAKPYASSEPKIFVVNVTEIVDRFIKSQTPLNLPDDELRQRVKLFSSTLEQELKQTAFQNKTLIMPSQAVIAGAYDLTYEITKKLDKTLAHLSGGAQASNVTNDQTP